LAPLDEPLRFFCLNFRLADKRGDRIPSSSLSELSDLFWPKFPFADWLELVEDLIAESDEYDENTDEISLGKCIPLIRFRYNGKLPFSGSTYRPLAGQRSQIPDEF
jgi:hypothetical protein